MSSEKQIKPTKCLIYCRVSSERQVKEGSGLDSQRKRCQTYAESKKYKVCGVFGDEGISGALFERPAMKKLIAYLDKFPHEKFVVIFDDLKRFARDYQVHLKLKLELIKTRGVKLECLNFNFDDSLEGEFAEGVIALQAELERKQNRRQVIQKQKARLEAGYWCFCSPIALKFIKDSIHGKILVRKEPYASIFQEALERYEKNLINTGHEFKNFVIKKYKEHDIDRPFSLRGAQDTLKKLLYSGEIEYKKWGVTRRKGHHQGIISVETYENIQIKLAGKSKKRLRKDYSLDFPLRGVLLCSECRSRIRGSWNSGRTKKYPNYCCQQEGCKYRYRTTNNAIIHKQFESILKKAKINKSCLELTKTIFKDVWTEKKQESYGQVKTNKLIIRTLENKIGKLIERISKSNNESLIRAYETEIKKTG